MTRENDLIEKNWKIVGYPCRDGTTNWMVRDEYYYPVTHNYKDRDLAIAHAIERPYKFTNSQ